MHKKKLIIVESPNKIKSIEKFVDQSAYQILASVGHILYLPASGKENLGINLETWQPKFAIDPKKRSVVKKLKAAAKESETILLATDPDREGEAIADNLVQVLKISDNYERIRFNEITKEAVLTAISHPAKIDNNLVNSQITRRMLDRIIGFKLSSLMRRKLSGYPQAPSAGRVQSIALKLAVEREEAINAFVSEKYFTINALIGEGIEAKYMNSQKAQNKNRISQEDIEIIFPKLNGPLVVEEIKKGIRIEKSYLPFKQAVLYRSAETVDNISSGRAQVAAQKLYENGLITYPRTDSTRLSQTFLLKAKKYITNFFGEKYFNKHIKGFAGSQDAHEAIRPSDIKLTPTLAQQKYNLEPTQYKMYKLIYTRTMLAIMSLPVKNTIKYFLKNHDQLFTLSTYEISFLGYYKFLKFEPPIVFNDYKKGDQIKVSEYQKNEHETQPPARFSEGSLIFLLDKIGVGRPSTFATTIRNIKDRKYVTVENRQIKPTRYGILIMSKLLEFFPRIINEKYTAEVETELDKIAENKHDYHHTMTDFYKNLMHELDFAYQTMNFEKLEPEKVGEDCPECGVPLIYRVSKKGDSFIACSGFPKCRYTASIPKKYKRKFTPKKTSKKKI